jgi:hypothetical protein
MHIQGEGLYAPSWISEVQEGFHVICRLLYVWEGGRVNMEGKRLVRGEGKGMA